MADTFILDTNNYTDIFLLAKDIYDKYLENYVPHIYNPDSKCVKFKTPEEVSLEREQKNRIYISMAIPLQGDKLNVSSIFKINQFNNAFAPESCSMTFRNKGKIFIIDNIKKKEANSLFNFMSENIIKIEELIEYSELNLLDNKTKYKYYLRELGKLKPIIKYLDFSTTPKKESFDLMIKIIEMFENAISQTKSRNKVTNVISGPFRISIYEDMVQCVLGSISIYLETAAGKFRYIDHAGLNLFTYIAEKANRIDNLNILASKRLINVL